MMVKFRKYIKFKFKVKTTTTGNCNRFTIHCLLLLRKLLSNSYLYGGSWRKHIEHVLTVTSQTYYQRHFTIIRQFETLHNSSTWQQDFWSKLLTFNFWQINPTSYWQRSVRYNRLVEIDWRYSSVQPPSPPSSSLSRTEISQGMFVGR